MDPSVKAQILAEIEEKTEGGLLTEEQIREILEHEQGLFGISSVETGEEDMESVKTDKVTAGQLDKTLGTVRDKRSGITPGKRSGITPGKSSGITPGKSSGITPGKSVVVGPGEVIAGELDQVVDQYTEGGGIYKAVATIKGAPKDQMTEEERLALIKLGYIITPSNHIILKDDRVITLEQARTMNLLKYKASQREISGEDQDHELLELEQKQEERKSESRKKIQRSDLEEDLIGEEQGVISVSHDSLDAKGLYYGSFASPVFSVSDESVPSVSISNPDTEYLKQVFGKALSLALAEITQVQPFDPIHYLAHWLFRYRYNQEIEIVKQRQIDELMAERHRIETENTHEVIQAEARQAVLDAWLRAEGIIMEQELMMRSDEEEDNFINYDTNMVI